MERNAVLLVGAYGPCVGGEVVGTQCCLLGYFDTRSGFEEAIRLLHGGVGDFTIVVNSLSPQMSELVEDAIDS